jgi:hypothetical protein
MYLDIQILCSNIMSNVQVLVQVATCNAVDPVRLRSLTIHVRFATVMVLNTKINHPTHPRFGQVKHLPQAAAEY